MFWEIYAIRWRIEIIFKAWKSHLSLDKIPQSVNRNELEVYIYAHLLNIIFFHVFFDQLNQFMIRKHNKYISIHVCFWLWIMTINNHIETLKNLLEQACFSTHGDEQERKYGGILADNFPNCELFWRHFVVPLTRRILVTDDTLGKDINFRKEIDDELRHIAGAHYSIFMHLAFAHHHIESQGSSCRETWISIWT